MEVDKSTNTTDALTETEPAPTEAAPPKRASMRIRKQQEEQEAKKQAAAAAAQQEEQDDTQFLIYGRQPRERERKERSGSKSPKISMCSKPPILLFWSLPSTYIHAVSSLSLFLYIHPPHLSP